MKKSIIAAVVLAAIGAALLLALSNLNSYLAENRDWLAEQARSAVGRPVKFDSIDVSFLGGFGVEVRNLAIADNCLSALNCHQHRLNAIYRLLACGYGLFFLHNQIWL